MSKSYYLQKSQLTLIGNTLNRQNIGVSSFLNPKSGFFCVPADILGPWNAFHKCNRAETNLRLSFLAETGKINNVLLYFKAFSTTVWIADNKMSESVFILSTNSLFNSFNNIFLRPYRGSPLNWPTGTGTQRL